MSLLVVGTVAFDAIETPFGKVDKIIGGSATYVGLSASYYDGDVRLVSVVGDDFPSEDIADFNARGIDTSGIQVKKGEKSFFWSGKYHHDMNSRDTLVTDLNVLADFDPKVPEEYRNSDFLMLGNIDPDLQIKVIDQMERRPHLIAMDTMNFWMDINLPSLHKVMTMVDILIVNDEEARQLTEEYSLVKAANRILDMGPRFLIIKKGEHGALLFDRDHVFFAPALPLEEVFDPTGAGDTFAGGFMGYIAKSRNLSFDNMKRGVIHGSAMASFCVSKFGPEKLKDLKAMEIEDRIQDFVELVHFDLNLAE